MIWLRQINVCGDRNSGQLHGHPAPPDNHAVDLTIWLDNRKLRFHYASKIAVTADVMQKETIPMKWILLIAILVSGCATNEEVRVRAISAIRRASDVCIVSPESITLLLDEDIPRELQNELAKIQRDDELYSPFSTRCISHDPPKGRQGEVFELSFYEQPPYCESNPYDLIVSIKYNRWKNGFDLVS